MKIAILKNEEDNSAFKWQNACEKFQIDYNIIDLIASDWYEKVTAKKYDLFLIKPGGNIERYKKLYDERIFIISEILNFNIFPGYRESYIYENKRLLSYYLKAQEIPHPASYVFYTKQEADDFIKYCSLPIVGKTSIGASGTGVEILKSRRYARKYVINAFSKKGIKRRFGPNRVVGSPKKWLNKAIHSPTYFLKRMKDYLSIYQDGQKGFVIFQEYIPHKFEWRSVKVGDSYFAHKKIKYGDKASGTKGIDYVNPPIPLIEFMKAICDINNFQTVAIDIFEHPERGYLVNEIQTIFGHVQTHIMEVNGKPGRYFYQNNKWVFEEGDFNTNESYDLRLETAIKLYR